MTAQPFDSYIEQKLSLLGQLFSVSLDITNFGMI